MNQNLAQHALHYNYIFNAHKEETAHKEEMHTQQEHLRERRQKNQIQISIDIQTQANKQKINSKFETKRIRQQTATSGKYSLTFLESCRCSRRRVGQGW